MSNVVDIVSKRRSLIPHSTASSTGADLLDVLSNCEAVDLVSTLRFDTTPADIDTIKSFIGNLRQRAKDRNGLRESQPAT